MKRVSAEAIDRDEVWFAIYRDLREELRGLPGIPKDYNPLAEIAKIGLGNKGGVALSYLCHKTVAEFTIPRKATLETPMLPGMKTPRRIGNGGTPELGEAADEWLNQGKKRA